MVFIFMVNWVKSATAKCLNSASPGSPPPCCDKGQYLEVPQLQHQQIEVADARQATAEACSVASIEGSDSIYIIYCKSFVLCLMLC
jgi:hypothetical protein